MNKYLGKYAPLMIVIIYAIFIASIFRLVVVPLNHKIAEKKKSAEEAIIDGEIYAAKMKEASVLKDKIEDAKKMESKLDVYIEDSNALPAIESIEKLAADTGNVMKIEVAGEGRKEDGGGKKKAGDVSGTIISSLPGNDYMTMNISLKGDFNSIYKFIKKMEDFRYFSDIISVKISSIEGEEAANILPPGDLPGNFVESQDAQAVKPRAEGEGQNPEEKQPTLEGTIQVLFYFKNQDGAQKK